MSVDMPSHRAASIDPLQRLDRRLDAANGRLDDFMQAQLKLLEKPLKTALTESR